MHTDDAQIESLRVRTSNLESGVVEIKSMIGGLSAKFDSHTRTPWVVIFTGMSLVGAILGGYITIQLQPINRSLDQFSAAIERIPDKYMRAEEVDRKFADLIASTDKQREIAGARRDDWQRYSEQTSQRMLALVDKLQEQVVPRGEHEEHWRGVDKQVTDLQRQIDEVKREQAGLYSARDIIKDDTDRIRQLEAKILGVVQSK